MTHNTARRQRARGTVGVNMMPMAGSLCAHYAGEIAVAASSRGCGCGSRSSGRQRRRGSPFAALSDAYKPPRAWLAPSTGRSGGEVLAVRSSSFTWPVPLNPISAEPRLLQKDLSSSPSRPRPPQKTADSIVMAQRQEDESATSPSRRSTASSIVDPNRDATPSGELRNPRVAEGLGAPVRAQKRSHRRRVTWAGAVETVEVARKSSCDVFSPDLLSLETAKRLAMLTREPELVRAVEAVIFIRRQSAGVIRSLTARHGWNGSLDGMEEACRLWTWRESAYFREMDEIVRCVVSAGERSRKAQGDDDVWGLKAKYRAARRRMEDAESD